MARISNSLLNYLVDDQVLPEVAFDDEQLDNSVRLEGGVAGTFTVDRLRIPLTVLHLNHNFTSKQR